MKDRTGRLKGIIAASLAVLLTVAAVVTVVMVTGGNRHSSSDSRTETVSVSDAGSSDMPVASEPLVSSEEPLSEEQRQVADELIERIVTYYGCYGAMADQKVDELLAELDGISTGEGRLWRDIMDYWEYMNIGFRVNEGSVPEGLPDGDNLCIVVLGHKLASDGSVLPELEGRLEKALECAEKYPNALVMCTGGGTASRHANATEAGRMCSWLVKNGLDSGRLIKEDQSKSTVENALNGYQILTRDYPQVDSILLVSSRYHLRWAPLLFEASFMKSSREQSGRMIHVVSHYASPVENSFFKKNQTLRWEAAGMFELIGRKDLADDFSYNSSYEHYMRHYKPKL